MYQINNQQGASDLHNYLANMNRKYQSLCVQNGPLLYLLIKLTHWFTQSLLVVFNPFLTSRHSYTVTGWSVWVKCRSCMLGVPLPREHMRAPPRWQRWSDSLQNRSVCRPRPMSFGLDLVIGPGEWNASLACVSVNTCKESDVISPCEISFPFQREEREQCSYFIDHCTGFY